MSITGKVYDSIDIKDKRECSTAEGREFRKSRECGGQVLRLKHLKEEYLDKGREVFVAFR